jgi:hypothetical protein
MTRADWEEAFARALVERSFRARLLADPAETLRDYGLAGAEAALVDRLRPRSLRGLGAQLRRLLPELRRPFGGVAA